jgi:4-amino-4-deoxy-L-arabinose transferase-like glycosyltransferase
LKKQNITEVSQDYYWGLGLFCLALILFTSNLGSLPLRDWDEGIIAQVSREILQGWQQGLNTWLYPTIHQTPYLNKPPLIHWFVAWSYHLGGVNETTARLPSALLTALSVPCLYGLVREIINQRLSAIFTSLVYLTLMPVIRHGRLAMLDGSVLLFWIITLWCILRCRRDLRYALPAGIALGLLGLTKGILLAVLLGAIALIFLWWDTPRLLFHKYFWLGIGLGMIPLGAWYIAQFSHYGLYFLKSNLLNQSLKRVWEDVGSNTGPVWYYLLEILENITSWQIFWLWGLKFANDHKNFSWGKLIIVWTSVYLIAISLMQTKLPWYVLPLYPAIAITTGIFLAEFWQNFPVDLTWRKFNIFVSQPINSPKEEKLFMQQPQSEKFYNLVRQSNLVFFSLLTLIGIAGILFFSGKMPFTNQSISWEIILIFLAVILTTSIAAFLLWKKDRQFLPILFWGTYVALFMFVNSQYWNWELAENYAVKPLAEIIQQNSQPQQKIYSLARTDRPSLNFYSDRPIIRVGPDRIQQEWQNNPAPIVLIEDIYLKNISVPSIKVLGQAEGWSLITRQANRKILEQ